MHDVSASPNPRLAPDTAAVPISIVRARPGVKGRTATPAARDRVMALCAGLEPRRDLLIEHLHRLQDAEGGLRPLHLAALAERLRLSQAEVFEVASFYHHFRLLRDDEAAPTLTVRVCTSVSCTLAGGRELLEGLQQDLKAQGIAVEPVPCIGRCRVRGPA